MNHKTMPVYLFVIASFLVAGWVSMVAVAKNDNAKNENTEKIVVKEKKSSDEQDKKNVKNETELKNYKKADTSKGETNAQIHREKTAEVIENLEQVEVAEEIVVDEVKVRAKNEAKKQIAEVVVEQESSQEQVSGAIEEVENDGVAKKFFLGPDYKNLGQLRSELVQNRNQIRKLIQAINTLAQNGEDTLALQSQLAILTQERERFKTIIATNQEGFSLFGWVARFLNNYEETPINETEENELTEEVVAVVENTIEGEATTVTNSTDTAVEAEAQTVPDKTDSGATVDVETGATSVLVQ
ncbi:MAG: hypothetical protein UR66_C0001G0103 [Candidatus Moranbacteria bacterium GW2011_GWE1_35_17]|nr:MAG: hypothetical protein UR66_C0001G0103 [Candidatus Moranbacteria bacterium GW2011_GWE1_35_17]KKP73119.1 MAG: hypothetical protein UR65_C0007G0005 [Candidatus Moranbacteria bacterium GW2011_GWE2_35_164]KKP85177.1 MAG: hypothetical protein UR83_C0003G0012 [Candidatus Moranbacteria bacterium GW2011_GWF2_35_54]OGS62818.1 MAG: hypothetical protein A2X07_10855 [Flavobacteria bacterium GWF1_32_7]